jgi:hypothetical protein
MRWRVFWRRGGGKDSVAGGFIAPYIAATFDPKATRLRAA